jgi:membrane-bound serine protease (ClpP class)
VAGTLALAVGLLVLGLLLIVAEVLFPSLGLLAVMATASFVASIWFAFKTGWLVGAAFVAVSLVLVPLLLYIGFKYLLPHSFAGPQIILSQVVSEQGESSGTDRSLRRFLGAEGVTRSYLRPAGVADIAGERVDVVTEGGMVGRGTRVRVIDVQGNRVVVRPTAGLAPREERADESRQ